MAFWPGGPCLRPCLLWLLGLPLAPRFYPPAGARPSVMSAAAVRQATAVIPSCSTTFLVAETQLFPHRPFFIPTALFETTALAPLLSSTRYACSAFYTLKHEQKQFQVTDRTKKGRNATDTRANDATSIVQRYIMYMAWHAEGGGWLRR